MKRYSNNTKDRVILTFKDNSYFLKIGCSIDSDQELLCDLPEGVIVKIIRVSKKSKK